MRVAKLEAQLASEGAGSGSRSGGGGGTTTDYLRKQRPVSLSGLAQRVTKLEGQAFRATLARKEEFTVHANAVPALVDATSAAQKRMLKVAAQHASDLDHKLQQFMHAVRECVSDIQQQHKDGGFDTERRRAEERERQERIGRELHERIGRCEARIANLLQDQARYFSLARGSGASTSESALPPASSSSSSSSSSSFATASPSSSSSSSLPAIAAAESSAASARKAFAAAEAAEIAASASARTLEALVEKQQRALDEGREREKRLAARCDALEGRLSDAAAASVRAFEAEAAARAEQTGRLESRLRDLEAAAREHDAEMRAAHRRVAALEEELAGDAGDDARSVRRAGPASEAPRG